MQINYENLLEECKVAHGIQETTEGPSSMKAGIRAAWSAQQRKSGVAEPPLEVSPIDVILLERLLVHICVCSQFQIPRTETLIGSSWVKHLHVDL